MCVIISHSIAGILIRKWVVYVSKLVKILKSYGILNTTTSRIWVNFDLSLLCIILLLTFFLIILVSFSFPKNYIIWVQTSDYRTVSIDQHMGDQMFIPNNLFVPGRWFFTGWIMHANTLLLRLFFLGAKKWSNVITIR